MYWLKTNLQSTTIRLIKKLPKLLNVSERLLMKHSSVAQTVAYWNIRLNVTHCTNVLQRHWMIITLTSFARLSWMKKSFAPSAVQRTGRKFVSSTWCSLQKWGLLLMVPWRFICVLKQLRVSLWTTWMCRRPAVWRYLSVLHRLVRHSVTRLLPVSSFSVCVSSNRWKCSSL